MILLQLKKSMILRTTKSTNHSVLSNFMNNFSISTSAPSAPNLKSYSVKGLLDFIEFNIPKHLSPLDVKKTVNVLKNTATLTPNPQTETIFKKVFNKTDADLGIPETGQIKEITSKAKLDLINNLIKDKGKVKLNKTQKLNAFKAMDRLFGLEQKIFDIHSASEVIEYMPKTTSSSFPDFITPKKDNFPNVLKQIEEMERLKDPSGIKNMIVTIAWRVQQRLSGIKLRIFYPLAHVIQVLERTFIQGFFNHFERNKMTPYCYGNIFPHLSIRYKGWQKYRYIYSLDYEKYDISISCDLIDIFFDYLERHIYFKKSVYLRNLFKELREYHKHAVVCVGMDSDHIHLIRKNNVLLSGSSLTNLAGSIINCFIIVVFLQQHGIEPKRNMISVMGDDVILACNKSFTIEYMKAYFLRTFEISISEKKSELFKPGDIVYFLGHRIDSGNRYLDPVLTIKQLCTTEIFISESVLPTEERILSKFCSLCFKCSDGHKFFQKYIQSILNYLCITKVPKFYTYMIQGNDKYEYLNTKISVREYMYRGWLRQ